MSVICRAQLLQQYGNECKPFVCLFVCLMNVSLDAAIQVSLTKNQRGQATPHRANAIRSSSATGVPEGEGTATIKRGW